MKSAIKAQILARLSLELDKLPDHGRFSLEVVQKAGNPVRMDITFSETVLLSGQEERGVL